MNIFAPLDANVNPEPTFWQSVPSVFDTNKAVVKHFGVLQVAEGELDIEVSQFALVGCKLFKFKGSWEAPSSISVVDLRWKVAEPFFEETDEGPIYGFSLRSSDFVVEFYAQDTESLDGWLCFMSCICILTGFEDDFQIVGVAGEGSTCVVQTAVSVDDQETYAIKRIPKSLLIDSPAVFKSMANEIEVLRTIKHPNVVKMYRVYDMETDICMVMEYLPHGDLATRLRLRKKFNEHDACKFVWTLLDTVDHLHDNDILHRDLKLENILMVKPDDDIEFRLADFGLSIYDTSEALKLRSGSPGYIAPEILENRPYGKLVDVFSSGIILYSLITGKLPFIGPDARAIIDLNRRCDIDYNVPELRKCSLECLAVLRSLTNRRPEERPSAAIAKQAHWFSQDSACQVLARSRIRPSKSQTLPSAAGLYNRRPMTFHEESKAIEFKSINSVPRVCYLARLRTAHPDVYARKATTFNFDQAR
mmetsp:Transcript_18732/g.33960  ORF Transcript_18732/g.33960 Transcript_18732/m.33960 type:complete len:476 (+) Transcript_18732:265-1692(+)|eukprot:CAMPEP_0204915438 /NCGR_PEP_ID=MMETSP1397-20131031/13436_1 /ASSEMBLY_ACC=CAM_ASM_000891 /TAXON_ID=49980 /ORGANISM="Climacostomum Climacostomum virens, Strain Stock W-24" /LENGTH=475 /DNA_ID=CAMNT_0052087481 /DNA_START=66 /DNA_END=1493 /DNA_ORIENTATION=-